MSVTARYSFISLFGPTLRALAFLALLFAAIFCALAGYGLLTMLLVSHEQRCEYRNIRVCHAQRDSLLSSLCSRA